MLHYMVGPAAEQALISSVSDRQSQTEDCSKTQPPVTCPAQPTDVTTVLSHPSASGENSSDDHPPEPDVVSPPASSEDVDAAPPTEVVRDVDQPTVVVDRLPVPVPVAHAQKVPKKRGRKPKRRRRLAAAALAENRPVASTEDLNANIDVRPPADVTSNGSQPNLDSCNSVQKDVADSGAVEHRPAPKKRGRKPKKRPEPEIAVQECRWSPARRSSGPAVAAAPLTAQTITATPTDSSNTNTLPTSGGNGNTGADSGTARRRGRKRKNTASDRDDQQQAKLSVDDGDVQSMWKVTSPECPDYSCNVVPRIKVTNVRATSASTRAGSAGESGDAGEKGTAVPGPAVTSSGSETKEIGGRPAALKVKSWQPIARRRDAAGTTIPVLDRAREWIHATPKPCRDDWTGPVFPAREPVFPARELVHVGTQNGSTDSQLAKNSVFRVPEKSPAKSRSRVYVEHHAGSLPWPVSAADVALGGLVATKKSVSGSSHPATATAAASQLMYMVDGANARGTPSASAALSQSHDYGRAVNSGAGRPAVCSFTNDHHSAQYTTKRVCRLNFLAVFRFLSCIHRDVSLFLNKCFFIVKPGIINNICVSSYNGMDRSCVGL